MKFNLSAGHNPDGKIACGAVGLIKESTEARAVKDKVIKYLKEAGHTVYDCTVNDGTSQSNVLSKIVKKCNAHDVDLDISIHFNAGGGSGTETLVYSKDSKAYTYAEKITDNIAKLGYKNRGVKVRKDLYVLANTKAPAVLIECCFVDSNTDYKIYDTDKLARAIVVALGVQPSSLKAATTNANTSNSSEIKVKVKVDSLNIRAGAGTTHKVVGMVHKGEVYTIVKRSGVWGKLKSGIGWINVSTKYVSRM